jgi:hypothetical protein
MSKLNQTARDTIKWDLRGLTIAGYIRHYFGDAGWGGDRCGCIDDRCIGFHHDDESDCGCLPVSLDDYAASRVASSVANEPSERDLQGVAGHAASPA